MKEKSVILRCGTDNSELCEELTDTVEKKIVIKDFKEVLFITIFKVSRPLNAHADSMETVLF
jgi:hypothetical protein